MSDGTNWIPCSELMPDDDTNYLIVVHIERYGRVERWVELASWDAERQCWYMADGDFTANLVTHWRLLPELPPLDA